MGGCPAMWSISHHRGYWSGESTVRPPQPRGSSCGAPLLGRRPSLALCAGMPVTGSFPWLRVTFAMVLDAAWLSLDQRPWIAARATGLAGRLDCPSASDHWFVVCCALPLCGPKCVPACGVRGPLALVHRCARHVHSVRGVRVFTGVRVVCGTRVVLLASMGSPPPPFFCVFVFSFFLKRGKAVPDARTLRAQAWAVGVAVVQCCVRRCGVCCWYLPAVAPQGCGSRVIMYTGAG